MIQKVGVRSGRRPEIPAQVPAGFHIMAEDVKQGLPAADIDIIGAGDRHVLVGMHALDLRLDDGEGMLAADFPFLPARRMGRDDAGLQLKRAFGNARRANEVRGQGVKPAASNLSGS